MLMQWRHGNEAIADTLFAEIEPTLRRLARGHLVGDRLKQNLQPTELVNEAAIKLMNARSVSFNDRAHFFYFASRIMRRVLVDEARKLGATKRPANQVTMAIDELAQHNEISILELDDALTDLAKIDKELAEILNLKFFGGLSNEEIATISDISLSTVKRRWAVARAWLYDHLIKSV